MRLESLFKKILFFLNQCEEILLVMLSFTATFLLILIMIVFANWASSLSNIADSSSILYLCSKSVITFVICNFLTILSIVTSIICVNMISLCKPFIMLNRIGLDTSSSTALSLYGIVSQMVWCLLQVFLCLNDVFISLIYIPLLLLYFNV